MTSSAGQRISCNVVETRRDDVARIFNIQRYSLNDGEGIRTVVFFKGCPHLCPWCANPGVDLRQNPDGTQRGEMSALCEMFA